MAPPDRLTPAQLEAEAAAAMAGAPIDDTGVHAANSGMPAPAGPSPEDIERGYAMLVGAVLDAGCGLACPAWNVTDAEKGKLAGALGHALNLWFPEAIPEKWVALIVVAGVGVEIVSARRDPKTGALLPRYHAPPPEPATDARPQEQRDPHAPIN